MFVASAVLAYGLAMLVKTKWFNAVLLKIGIHRTINDDLWADVIRDGCFLRVFSKDGTKSYSGVCEYWESHKSEPIVVLTRYQILNDNAEVVIDFSNDINRKIVLNLKEFERVDVVQTCKNPTEHSR